MVEISPTSVLRGAARGVSLGPVFAAVNWSGDAVQRGREPGRGAVNFPSVDGDWSPAGGSPSYPELIEQRRLADAPEAVHEEHPGRSLTPEDLVEASKFRAATHGMPAAELRR